MKLNRREFIGSVAAAGLLAAGGKGQKRGSKIDRYALVTRHNPRLTKFEPLSPLSVGNGEFAFTCDATGLQTFPELYENAMPLCTMAQWGWHTKPIPDSLKGKEYQWTEYDTYGRKVRYQTGRTGQQELYDYLRENPHRLHLGRIGLVLKKADGTEAKPEDISKIDQKLDLWTGVIESRFEFDGELVVVRTAADTNFGAVAFEIDSSLVGKGRVGVRVAFPYGAQNMNATDWTHPEAHETKAVGGDGPLVVFKRRLDADGYAVTARSSQNVILAKDGAQQFVITPQVATSNFDLSIGFVRDISLSEDPRATRVFENSKKFWQNFWTSGAAIELSKSADPRAFELERRVVLSQYLTAINCSGSLPPAETGLTTNSWYGKFHLEMHWWHAAQFALWGRVGMLENSLDYYERILPSAREKARLQGYDGVRWPKMTDGTGRDSPSPIGPLLIWQQPHPIFYAELVYLNKPTRATLLKFAQVIEETAKFMASYAYFDAKTNRYVLGPPVIPAQENHPARETWNPTFELEYWRWGLKKANEWRERLKKPRVAKWDEVVAKLSKLPVKDGVYMAHENCPQTFTERNIDHPSMLGALGILPGEMVDRETMRRTLFKVMKEWNWDDTWGWDYPMTAMTAARLGEPATAIDALLKKTPKNGYAASGHNYQRPNLPLYLPGNGGLLYAIAMMAAGWKGAPKGNAPGFPKDWKVSVEGFDPKVFAGI